MKEPSVHYAAMPSQPSFKNNREWMIDNGQLIMGFRRKAEKEQSL